jgi:hypothetical protein
MPQGIHPLSIANIIHDHFREAKWLTVAYHSSYERGIPSPSVVGIDIVEISCIDMA